MKQFVRSIERSLGKLGKIISKSKRAFCGWFGRWMEKGDLYLTDHLNDDRCVECGGKLVFDEELTTRKGYSETVTYICTCCGKEHVRIAEFD